MILILVLIGILICCLLSGNIRFIICHPITTIPAAFKDLYFYFKHKEYNRCPYIGKIQNYCSLSDQVFGCGKTLTLVKKVREVYKRYNNTEIWSRRHNKMVTQHIKVVSNVAFTDIPYIPFKGIDQFTHIEEIITDENDIVLFVIDEMGSLFNSRDFKDNFSPEALARLLTLRKVNGGLSLFGTSQRWGLIDKVIRTTSSSVLCTSRFWRITRVSEYSALDLENCQNIEMLRPLSVHYWFSKDEDYAAYNTYALDFEIEKKAKGNEFLSTEEIINNAGSSSGSLDQAHLKRKYQRKTKL